MTTIKKPSVRFRHRWEHPIITIESQKLGRIDGETKAGVHVEFHNHVADVSDEKIIEELKNGPSFGVDYFIETDSVPFGIVPPKKTAPTAGKMPGELEKDDKLAEEKEWKSGVESSIAGIGTLLTALSRNVDRLLESQEPQNAPGNDPEAEKPKTIKADDKKPAGSKK